MPDESRRLPREVVAVVGPTATGKTALAVALAHSLNTEIISADSQVLYRGLDIGTAKPTQSEQEGIPHHLIDVAEPNKVYSAATYQAEANAQLERLWHQGKTPIVAGGTGFYLKALLQAEFIPDVPPNPDFRQAMHNLADREGLGVLYQRLIDLDPLRAADLHPNDRVRIIRALEIIDATGQPVPRQSHVKSGLRVHWLGLMFEDRDQLRARIDQRITAMMAQGWLEEVEGLVQHFGPDAHALQVAHGYPELVQVVLGQRTLADALSQIQINIHQYARRQMTWFRRNPNIHWLAADQLSPEVLQSTAKTFITSNLKG